MTDTKEPKKTTVVVTKVTPAAPPPQTPPEAQSPAPVSTAVAKAAPVITADHFLAPAPDAAPDGPHQAVAGYVQFVSTNTKNDETKDAFKASGGKLPGFLHTEAGLRIAVQPFRYHLFAARLIYTKIDGGGKVVAAIPTDPGKDSDQWKKEKYRPHYYALVGVIAGDTIRPATVNGRNGLARCFKVAAERLAQLKTPAGLSSWAAGGEKYKLTVAGTGKRPSGMFIAQASGKTTPFDDGSGFSFNEGQCTIEASGPTDLARFMACINSPEWCQDYALAHNNYQDRVQRLLSGGEDEEANE